MERPIPYSGQDTYIFVSYAHRNSDRVYPIIHALQAQGFRIWFDDGIDPGSEWDENIAFRIKGCSYLLAFLTSEYMQSQNCRDELNFARDLNKPRLLVYLDPVELPDGMAMRLNRLQAIHWYTYKNDAVALSKICAAQGISVCRNEVPAAPVVSDAPAADSAAPAPVPAAKLPRWIVPAISSAAAAALVLLAFLLPKFLRGSSTPDPTIPAATIQPTTTPVVTEPAATEPVQYNYHITLHGENMSVRQFNEALEILTGRLDILADGMDYSMTVDQDTITLDLPEVLFHGLKITNVLRCYLTRAMQLYIADFSSSGADRRPISRDDLASVTLKNGLPENVTIPEKCKDLTQHIEIVLTDDCAGKYADLISAWGDNLIFAQDMESDTWFYVTTVALGDGKTFYLLNSDPAPFPAIEFFNYTHPALSSNFTFQTQILAHWEDPAAASLPGAYQCSDRDFTGKSIVMLFSPSSSEDFTPGKWLDVQTVFKARLDALETPYVFGTGDVDYSITVKIAPEYFNDQVMSLLRSNSTAPTLRTSYYYYVPSSKETQLVQSGSEYVLPFSDTSKDRLEILLADSDRVTLTTNNIPVLEGTIDAEAGSVRFDRLAYSDKPLTQEPAWILRLIQAVVSDQPLDAYYSGSWQYGADESGVYASESDLADVLIYHPDEDLMADLNALCPGADITWSDSALRISLHHSVDASLPQDSARIAREVYDLVGPEHTRFTDISIYLIDEDDNANERARIFFHTFSRSIYSSSTPEPGYVYVSGIFRGGRLDPFVNEFRQIVENDSFFQSKMKDYGGLTFS